MQLSELLHSTGKKTEELISRHRRMKEELEGLRKQFNACNTENNKLKSDSQILNEENRMLKEQIKTIKLAQSLTNGTGDQGSRQVKMKINEYIREIDKCLSLLNRE